MCKLKILYQFTKSAYQILSESDIGSKNLNIYWVEKNRNGVCLMHNFSVTCQEYP